MDGEESDCDSISLLKDLPAIQSGPAAADTAAANVASRSENTEDENQIKPKQRTQRKQAKLPKPRMLHLKNGRGETRLHVACIKNDLPQVKMLIQSGVDVNMQDNAGWTALHEASAVGGELMVVELLKAGANVDARSFDGVTPLHDAVSAGHYQVVKVLLQNGSNPSDRDVGGLTALDMVKDERIKRLLESSLTSPAVREKGQKHTVQNKQTESSVPLYQKSKWKCNASQRVKSHRVQSHSEAVTAVLKGVGMKQAEMSTWPVTDLKDAAVYRAGLRQNQRALMGVLAKQRLEKDSLTQKYRTMPEHFRHRVLRSQFHSLASCQRTLVELLQKQLQMDEKYLKIKAKIFSLHLNYQCDITPLSNQENQAIDHSDAQVSMPQLEKAGSCRKGSGKSLPQCLPPKDKKCHVDDDPQSEEASGWQTSPQQGTALHLINFKRKGKNVLIQSGAESDGRCLRQLLQGGVLAPGNALQLILKGKQHVAHLHSDGSILSQGRLHQTPKCWMESILGNNIPVSSTYALDKVTFKEKSLSHYFLQMQESTSQKTSEDSRPDSAPQKLSPEIGSLKHLLSKIKIIHLIKDEELLPNAIMDFYWEKLIKQTRAEFEDWDSKL